MRSADRAFRRGRKTGLREFLRSVPEAVQARCRPSLLSARAKPQMGAVTGSVGTARGHPVAPHSGDEHRPVTMSDESPALERACRRGRGARRPVAAWPEQYSSPATGSGTAATI